jgi:hypothetical protein
MSRFLGVAAAVSSARQTRSNDTNVFNFPRDEYRERILRRGREIEHRGLKMRGGGDR